jgi:AcrR family transcriptional regulator
MVEKLDTILQKAKNIFMRYGLRSVTMDDVCREMGISKKTLYQFVSDKSDLVKKSIEHEIAADKSNVCKIHDLNLNAIEEMLQVNNTVGEKLKNLHPSLLFEMQKYYPEAWAVMSQYRREFIVKIIHENIIKGQTEGLYRTDINPDIISKLYATKVELLTDLTVVNSMDFTPLQLFEENIKYHIRGISNAKGQDLLEKYLTTHK